jgi:hypothetical protein
MAITCTDYMFYSWLPQDGLTLTTTRMNSGHCDGGEGGMAGEAQRYPTSPNDSDTTLTLAIPTDNLICSH